MCSQIPRANQLSCLTMGLPKHVKLEPSGMVASGSFNRFKIGKVTVEQQFCMFSLE